MSKAITIRVDDATKHQAEEILEEIGLTMSAYINSSLKALTRERKVPFELTTAKRSEDDYLVKIDNSIEEARNGEVYQYFGNGKFSEDNKRINV